MSDYSARWSRSAISRAAVSNRSPYDFFNTHMDAQRGIAARWFADSAPMSRQEQVEEAIPERLRLSSLEAGEVTGSEGWWMSRTVNLARAEAEMQQQERSPWEQLWDGTVLALITFEAHAWLSGVIW